MVALIKKNLLVSILAIVLSPQLCSAAGGLIDDFEDGVIDTTLWAIGEGNYDGGNGWGTVDESNGRLILDSFDGEQYGAGVSYAILKQSFVDVPVLFSFDLTIYDSTLSGPPYIPDFTFMLTDDYQAVIPSGMGRNVAAVYAIVHDQQQPTNQYSGTYYFFLDSTVKEARLYNATDDSLLGWVSYAHFDGNDPYIAFDAYTDAYSGSISERFELKEISVVPEPATLGLMLVGGLVLLRRRREA